MLRPVYNISLSYMITTIEMFWRIVKICNDMLEMFMIMIFCAMSCRIVLV